MVAEHSDKAWRVAQEVIAAELVQLVMDNTQLLARIQRRVLVPLEFCLMYEEEVAPLELAYASCSAIKNHVGDPGLYTRATVNWQNLTSRRSTALANTNYRAVWVS
jgi:hypothetical protein